MSVVDPGDRRYPLADRVEAVPLADLVGPGADPASIFRQPRR